MPAFAYGLAWMITLGLGESNAPTVRANCDRSKDVGRVKCAVVLEHAKAAWADVSVIALPESVSALRGRVNLAEADASDQVRVAWSLGLVAQRATTGQVVFRVRWVACDGQGACVPAEREVRADLSIAQ